MAERKILVDTLLIVSAFHRVWWQTNLHLRYNKTLLEKVTTCAHLLYPQKKLI